MTSNDGDRYIANLYYHGRLDQQFSGNIFNYVLTQLHLCVASLASGATGNIVDRTQEKTIHSCSYTPAE